jgi:hypothetical protein
MRMHIVQACALALVGNLCNQVISGSKIEVNLLLEQVCISLFLAPATVAWLDFLRRKNFHWSVSTLLDQFCFSAVMNIVIFFFRAAVFKGGLVIGLPGIRVVRSAFPSIWDRDPIWGTRIKGLQLKLPTTLLRELIVPAHLKGIYELVVAFVWSMMLAAVLAKS